MEDGKMKKTAEVVIYDTTLRDGTQGEQINFSAEEKLRIALRLDDMGFHYIEGGWPASNPKDSRFFELAKTAKFQHARLAAFGSTRKPYERPQDCPNLQALIAAGTPVVTIFGKTWDLHVIQILETTLQENLAMIGDSVGYLKSHGREVVYDAEHFFDGYKNNAAYARKTLEAALAAGADWIVLCDTNGGTLTHEIVAIVGEVSAFVPLPRMGVHVHNDGGVAVANSIAAVHAGVKMVQGTVNGFGERCGNADLIPIMANLQLKMKKRCLSDAALRHLTSLSNYISDIANTPPVNSRPFVGRSAFAHKGGVHVSAVVKNAAAYEHIRPELVGNQQRVLVSDLAGKSNIEYKARQLGVDLGLDKASSRRIVREIKKMEDGGYQFDAAEGSLAILIKKQTGEFVEPFNLESYHVLISKRGDESPSAQASIKITVGDEQEVTAAEGKGPVNALDNALRKALTKFYPQLSGMHLVDFKVRIVEGSEGTAALVKVLIDTQDEDEVWSTIGVSENVIEASWHALVDSVHYKLSKHRLNNNQRTSDR